MPAKTPLLDHWTHEQAAPMGHGAVVAGHQLGKLELFTDAGLMHTLDRHPRAALGVNTMGDDPTRRGDWREGEAGDLDAHTLLDAVRNGRLWLNLRRVMDHHPDYDELVHALYDEVEAACPGLKTYNRSANLLISSPTALVYYHMDCPVNMLWHIRGEKRVWVYPLSAGVLSDETLEAVLAGDAAEEVEYRPEFDEVAEVYEVRPGQMITWPQHTPHRVVNTSGLNVSLSTEHMTRKAARKNNVYLANRHFRQLLGGNFRSTKLEGLAPATKEAALRVCRRVPGLAPEPPTGFAYPVTFRVDPDAPLGVCLLDGGDPTTTTPIAPATTPTVSGDMSPVG